MTAATLPSKTISPTDLTADVLVILMRSVPKRKSAIAVAATDQINKDPSDPTTIYGINGTVPNTINERHVAIDVNRGFVLSGCSIRSSFVIMNSAHPFLFC